MCRTVVRGGVVAGGFAAACDLLPPPRETATLMPTPSRARAIAISPAMYDACRPRRAARTRVGKPAAGSPSTARSPRTPLAALRRARRRSPAGRRAISRALRSKTAVSATGQSRVHLVDTRRVGVRVPQRLGRRRLGGEGPLPGEQLEGDDRQRVAIARRSGGDAGSLLGRDVSGRAEHRAGARQRHEAGGPRDTEVADVDDVRAIEEQVPRLDIPVDDSLTVRDIECVRLPARARSAPARPVARLAGGAPRPSRPPCRP